MPQDLLPQEISCIQTHADQRCDSCELQHWRFWILHHNLGISWWNEECLGLHLRLPSWRQILWLQWRFCLDLHQGNIWKIQICITQGIWVLAKTKYEKQIYQRHIIIKVLTARGQFWTSTGEKLTERTQIWLCTYQIRWRACVRKSSCYVAFKTNKNLSNWLPECTWSFIGSFNIVLVTSNISGTFIKIV